MVLCVASSVLGVKERRNSVIAGKFAADFSEELHAMMKEYAACDNLPAKQSRWEISLHNARDPSWMRQPASDKSSVGHTCWVWNAIILEISARRADIASSV
jgi:hypothetical protein